MLSRVPGGKQKKHGSSGWFRPPPRAWFHELGDLWCFTPICLGVCAKYSCVARRNVAQRGASCGPTLGATRRNAPQRGATCTSILLLTKGPNGTLRGQYGEYGRGIYLYRCGPNIVLVSNGLVVKAMTTGARGRGFDPHLWHRASASFFSCRLALHMVPISDLLTW